MRPSCTVTRMQPLRWESRPDGSARPSPRLRVQGLERRRRRGLGRAAVRRRVAEGDPLRDDRPGGVLRLPGDAPPRRLHRGPHARDHLAGGRGLRRARAARPARPHPPPGHRAVLPLAHVLPARHRPGRGARLPDGREPRRATGRRPAHPAGLHHRALLGRVAHREPRDAADLLRGADRHRRRAAGRGGPRRACRPPRSGRACRTTSRPRRTRRRPSRSCASSSRSSACRSTRRSSRRPPRDYERQVSLAVQSDPDVQAFVERLEQAAADEEPDPEPGDLPSGDVLAREFQRFLRQRGPGEA